jgi:hypothetical protein
MELQKILQEKHVWEDFAEDMFRLKWQTERDLNYIKIWVNSFRDNLEITNYFWKNFRDEFITSKLQPYNKVLIDVLKTPTPDIEIDLIHAAIPILDDISTSNEFKDDFDILFIQKLISLLILQ